MTRVYAIFTFEARLYSHHLGVEPLAISHNNLSGLTGSKPICLRR